LEKASLFFELLFSLYCFSRTCQGEKPVDYFLGILQIPEFSEVFKLPVSAGIFSGIKNSEETYHMGKADYSFDRTHYQL